MAYKDEGKASLKVILVGSSGVGKTSLISAFFDNPFENQELSTVAPASCTATITLDDGAKVNLQIWDTAGQEKFQSISQMFYRDSNVAFVCYDHERDNTIEEWVNRVRNSVPECKIFLVTTKSDLLTQEQQTECVEKGNEYLQRYGACIHLLTSACSGFGVKELFQEAAKYYNEINSTVTEKKNTIDINDKNNNQGAGGKKCC
ncbi:small GTP-binding protein [Histomonas meleagridis]|uniref:small GTP-binding protein n=1 Tax=Histomonas meleagridis TaxID=135588 RepID=UPI0035596236|nr:small GTP-binding protein [Histomonas meleagridis]KAH0800897.1 small GTP-binding protein [Histomonas meleagridis]